MNIKYIALFSLTVIAHNASAFGSTLDKMDALDKARKDLKTTQKKATSSPAEKSRAELLDESRKALRQCLATNQVMRFATSGKFGCDTLEKNYHEAKNNFLAPFEQYGKEGIEANNMFDENTQSALYNLPLIGDFLRKRACRKDENLVNQSLLAIGSAAIIYALADEKGVFFTKLNGPTTEKSCFLNNEQPTTTIAKNAIYDGLKHIDTTLITPEQVIAAEETLIKTINS